jgi:Family of unknown function (DUF5995)
MQHQPARTIDEVIDQLNGIIDTAIQAKDPIGIFPALYVVVTHKVKEGIQKGTFKDGPRMERLDVLFANRYLEAYHTYQAGGKPSGSWLAAFRAAENGKTQLILQYLLMGINAHINLDLGIAAEATAPGPALEDLHHDFNTINAILASLVDVVKGDLETFSPRFRLILKYIKNEDAILEFSMNKAREAAWKFAEKLAERDADEQARAIKFRDDEVMLLAQLVRRPGLIGSLIVWWVKRAESTDIPAIIRVLRDKYTHLVNIDQFKRQN